MYPSQYPLISLSDPLFNGHVRLQDVKMVIVKHDVVALHIFYMQSL